MFGSLKPKTCQLDRESKKAWQQLYCGSCQSLGNSFNFLSRLTLSYDQVFFALLIESLQEDPSEASSCRCPAAPWIHRPILDPESAAMKLSAAIHILLVDQWLYDQTIDRTWLWQLIRSLIQPQANKATNLLSSHRPVIESLESFTDRQTQLESKKIKPTPLEAAEPTAELLALLFESLVAPMSPRYDDPDLISTLGNLGHSLGVVIYLIDALEDLEDDQKTKQFSVCLSNDFKPDLSQIEVVLSILKFKQKELSELLLKLPIVRHQAILNHIISDRLNVKVMTLVEKYTTPKENSTQLSLVKRSYQRGSQVIQAMMHSFTFGITYVFKRLKFRFFSIFQRKPQESHLFHYQTSVHGSYASCGSQTLRFLSDDEHDNKSCCDDTQSCANCCQCLECCMICEIFECCG